MIRALLLALLLVGVAAPALAVDPDEVLDDPALEQRARDLSKQLRCVVCQNESIDTSNAEIAKTMRLVVRDRLLAGDSDDEIMAYMVSRYGEYVLMEPELRPGTYLLWFGPAILLAIGGLGVFFYLRRRPASGANAAPDLTPEERARLDALMKEREES